MTIREASDDDIDAIRDVARTSWEADYPDILSRETIEEGVEEWYDTDALHEAVSDTRTRLLVADEGDAVVGFVHAVLNGEDEGDILRLYVHPEHRRKGIGHRLFERVRDDLYERDVDRIYAMVLADNDLGNAFYRDLGLERVTEEETTIGGDAVREHTFALERA